MKARTSRKGSPVRRRKVLRGNSKLSAELNIGTAKARFSELIDAAARGARFVIAKAGIPVARVVPLEAEPEKFVFGTLKGVLSPEDEKALLDTIEAPLPGDVLEGFHVGRLEAN